MDGDNALDYEEFRKVTQSNFPHSYYQDQFMFKCWKYSVVLETRSRFRRACEAVNAPRLASRLKILHAVAATAGKSRHYFASMLREQLFE